MNREIKQLGTLTVSLCWLTASQCRKPVTAVFGTGGHLRLAWVVWSWRGLVARLSICPLENSPELLETIMAPVEEIAITISDGREGAISILGIWPDLWLEHVYKVPLRKYHPLNTIGVIPHSFRLSTLIFTFFLSGCIGVTVHLKPSLRCKLSTQCQCLMNHTRSQQVDTSNLWRKTCFCLNAAFLHSVTDRIWSGQSQLQLETAHPLASHLSSSCSGMCD